MSTGTEGDCVRLELGDETGAAREDRLAAAFANRLGSSSAPSPLAMAASASATARPPSEASCTREHVAATRARASTSAASSTRSSGAGVPAGSPYRAWYSERRGKAGGCGVAFAPGARISRRRRTEADAADDRRGWIALGLARYRATRCPIRTGMPRASQAAAMPSIASASPTRFGLHRVPHSATRRSPVARELAEAIEGMAAPVKLSASRSYRATCRLITKPTAARSTPRRSSAASASSPTFAEIPGAWREGDAIFLAGVLALPSTAPNTRPCTASQQARQLRSTSSTKQRLVEALARVAATCSLVHDASEGGLAVALAEAAIATGSVPSSTCPTTPSPCSAKAAAGDPRVQPRSRPRARGEAHRLRRRQLLSLIPSSDCRKPGRNH